MIIREASTAIQIEHGRETEVLSFNAGNMRGAIVVALLALAASCCQAETPVQSALPVLGVPTAGAPKYAAAPAPNAGVTLTTNVSSFSSNVVYVQVSFSGVKVSPGDAIAFVQNASTTNYSVTPPQKFKWVVTSNSSSALTSGSGSVV